jgi:hypothetical protein
LTKPVSRLRSLKKSFALTVVLHFKSQTKFMVIIIFIIVLAVIILVHEVGHFLLAKLCGVKVEEFGLGLPPRVWGKKIGETLYSINWIPVGGFVRMLGEDLSDNEKISDSEKTRSFSHKSKWKQALDRAQLSALSDYFSGAPARFQAAKQSAATATDPSK